MRRMIVLLLALAIGCPACFAGNGPDQKHVEKIKNQVSKYLEEDRMVSVETYDQYKMRGIIHEAGPDEFVLTVAGSPTPIPYTNVKKIKAPLSPEAKHRIFGSVVLISLLVFPLLAVALGDH